MRTSHATAAMSALTLVLAGLTIPACVTDSDYQETSRQADTTRIELEQTRAETDSLEKQLISLEKEVASLTSRSQTLSKELKELRESQAQEQLTFDETVGRMHQAAITLKSQNRALRQDFEQQQKENIALAALVQRYSRELEESPAPTAPVPVARPAVVQIPSQGVQTNGAPHQVSEMTPPVRPAAPAAPKPAVPVEQPPPDEGWLAYLISWLMALWHLIF
jgi:seryl-tRNA synthetase